MGKWYFFLSLIFLGVDSYAQIFELDAATEGCPAYCRKKARGNQQAYDACIALSKQEGYCGRRSSTPAPSAPVPETKPPVSKTPNSSGAGQEQVQSEMTYPDGDHDSMVWAYYQGCHSEFQDILKQCQEQLNDTARSCDEKSDSGMNNAMDMTSQLTLALGQNSAASIQAACSSMGNVSAAANAALAAYRMNCSSSMNSCRTTCEQAVQYIQSNRSCFEGNLALMDISSATAEAKEARGRCDEFESKVNEAQQAIQNIGANSLAASRCKELTQGDAPPPFCKANPQYPGCSPAAPVDCSDPTVASTNKVCICSRNPLDPTCSAVQKASVNDAITGGGSFDQASRLQNNSMSSDDFGGNDLFGLPSIEHGTPPSGGVGTGVDGRQGSGSPISGSDGSSAGNYGKASADGTDDSSVTVTSGFYGGGGNRFAQGADSTRHSGTTVNGSAIPSGGPPKPDLRQFLPGGKFDPRLRGVAGMGGIDGITGPHSNIWQKIQNRYRVLIPTLMP